MMHGTAMDNQKQFMKVMRMCAEREIRLRDHVVEEICFFIQKVLGTKHTRTGEGHLSDFPLLPAVRQFIRMNSMMSI